MADLSPAAQAVLDAFRTSHTGQGCLAAALRAAASQLTSTKAMLQLQAIAADLADEVVVTEALWQRIGGKTGPYDLGPAEIAGILMLIAAEVERRGERDEDRDPGETADWLRAEAQIARKAIVF